MLTNAWLSLTYKICTPFIIRMIVALIVFSYERTPIDEAVTRGKMDVLDAINAAAAQVELTGVSVS